MRETEWIQRRGTYLESADHAHRRLWRPGMDGYEVKSTGMGNRQSTTRAERGTLEREERGGNEAVERDERARP